MKKERRKVRMIYDESSSEDERDKVKLTVSNNFYRYATVYTILQLIFIYYGFGMVFFAISILGVIVWNTTTGRRDGNTLSAYSVFNKNFQRLEGDVDPQALNQQLMRGGL